MEMNEQHIMHLARAAGLPISWWDKAKSEGKDPPCWRELSLFARLVRNECVDSLVRLQYTHRVHVTEYEAGIYRGLELAIDNINNSLEQS